MKWIKQLTEREKEVVKLLVDGYDNREVGEILMLAKCTVESHRAKIMLKLQLHDFAALVKYAISHHITTVDKHRHYTQDGQPPPQIPRKQVPRKRANKFKLSQPDRQIFQLLINDCNALELSEVLLLIDKYRKD